ncbi:MAG: glucoamylase family protein, partial [Pseudomonadota bacterium]
MLQAELFSIEQLKRHAVTLADQHRRGLRTGPDRLLPRLADNERVLQEAYDVVTRDVASGQQVVPAEAWLLDNFYLIEQQISLARRHLPRGFSSQLPGLVTGPLAGLPRIYELALELISHMDGRVDNDNVTSFIAAYQSVEPLMLGELWAFPIMLQLALLENLRCVGLRIAQSREEYNAAVSWADRMLATAETEPKKLIRLLAEFANADIPLTAPFVEEFYERLRAQESALAFVQTWVEQQLLEQGVTPASLSEAAGRNAAANQISMANSIGSLRFIDTMDWSDFVESLSAVEQILREDPIGVGGNGEGYASQDFATRDRYRHVVEDLARSSQFSEMEVAHEAIALARQSAAKIEHGLDRRSHVGYYLIDEGRARLEHAVGYRPGISTRLSRWRSNLRLPLYVGPILLLSVLLTAVVLAAPGSWSGGLYRGGSDGLGWWVWLFSLPLLIAASALATPLVNLLAALTLPPRVLPRLDFAKGIPEHHRTMVVVPTLLTSEQDADDLLEALEIRYLGNRDANVFFALLTDFADASEQTLPGDEALLDYARNGIKALNETYNDDRPCVFYLFHRPRRWNPYERVWMGYERKRGKLAQFNARLRGEAVTAFSAIVGDCSVFRSIRYVITLDTDTQLPRDAAHALVGNLAHPLNRPVYDAGKGRVVEGYAILQPRVSISLVSAGQSRFARLFAGDSGLDPYTREVSDVYQDVFGEGSFIGKGIYDVDAFREATNGRFPENLILSHDLLEGGYARSGLVTDVELIEAHPASYTQESSRRHRWIRGDWQLAGWLLPWVREPAGPEGEKLRWHRNPLTALSRWKLFDNLRRSLVAPSLLVLLIAGWLTGPGPGWLWTLWVLAVIVLPAAISSVIELIRKPRERDWLVHLALTGKSTGRPVALALLTLVFLPYDALVTLGAMLRSQGRMLFSRRGLLLWQLPSYARRNACRTLSGFFREMWVAPVLALALAALFLTSGQPANGLFAAPVLLLWALSPVFAWWISLPLVAPPPGLGAGQRAFLRTSARQTWRYFADFVGPDDNWLPPDNFQVHPAPAIASRTSPTNIGMSLLADLTAVDFGYLTVGECLQRTESTLASMEKLERYHGHFYNWYDTRTLQPLRPCYISSVDSGNLAGSLLTLRGGLAELKDMPILPPSAFAGLQDTLTLLAAHLPDSVPPELAQRVGVLQVCLERLIGEADQTLSGGLRALNDIDDACSDLADLASVTPGLGDEPVYWARSFDSQLRAFREELTALVPETWQGSGQPCRQDLVGAGGEACRQVDQIDRLIRRCDDLAEMDFSFLYDTASGLLTIGYDVGERRRDPACYDLLASEARLASFLLIAQGQVPQKHWFTLGRLLTSHGSDISLISWSGSMFEYLMPQLIMPSYPDTLLDQTCKAAVMRQIEYGRQRAVPWGISESCYNATDVHQVYQYRAFGVPGLGFKRGLGDDLVIAPYATALALTVMPRESCRNLQVLAEQGFVGSYGFYEAIDYTPSRVPHGKSYVIVRTFMAHHQGMSLLAFAHVLLGQPMQRRFMADPQARATELLLQERVPRKGATLHPHAAEVSAAAAPPGADADSTMRVFSDTDMQLPEVHLLSNGRYHVMATHAGGGISRWHDMAITRWREDATTDSWGTFIYLRDVDTGDYWSAAHQPTRRQADDYSAIFVQARAEYRRCDLGIETHTEISVSPEDDVEIRRLTLTNQSTHTRHIEVTSYAEVVLAPLNADLAHRSFSNLFVQTEILPEHQAILCTRRRRTPGEQVPWMFHLLAAPGVTADQASYETDRARFIGRGRTAANPLAMENSNTGGPANNALSNTEGPVLDPVVAIRNTLSLAPDRSATVQIISGIADTREAALALLEKYCDRHFVERAFEMSWFQSQEVLRHLNVTEADAQVFGRLANSVIFGNALRRAEPSIIARNRLRQSSLWPFAISGDLPIVLLHIGDVHRIDLVKQVLNAHAYWRMKGLTADLVIINEDFSGYRAVLQDLIVGLINGGSQAQLVDKPGGVFLRRAEEISQEDRVLLQTVARIVFRDTAETRIEQVERRISAERRSDRLEPQEQPADHPVVPLEAPERIFFNGLGGFSPDGREYVITLEPGQVTPAPWANVIASPHIGTVVSESGSAYTWAENAHEFRLTTWHNDPLSDISGEAFYLRDEQTGEFWSPTPLPAAGHSGYLCRHGFGYSVFEHLEAGIASKMITYVAMDAAVKFVVVTLENRTSQARSLSLTGYWELVMGEWRHSNLMHI